MTLQQQIKQLREEVTKLRDYRSDPRVVKVIELVMDERRAKINDLEDKLHGMSSLPKLKPSRWPDNTPAEVIEQASAFYAGTTESHKFRIHAWNDKGIVVSYPGGTWSDNGGQHYGQALYSLLSRTETKRGMSGNQVCAELQTWSGRVSKKTYQTELDNL